jgi:hypothetical protein
MSLSPQQIAANAPKIERIAANIVETLQTVQVANGYSFDLAPIERRKSPENTAAHLKVIVAYSDESQGEAAFPFQRRTQNFQILVYYMQPDTDATPVDQALIMVWADVYRALRVDRTRGALAWNTEITGFTPWPDAVVIDVAIEYECSDQDPRN